MVGTKNEVTFVFSVIYLREKESKGLYVHMVVDVGS